MDAEARDLGMIGPIGSLNAIQVKGYHRSNWIAEDPARDPEYQGHSRPLLGFQVTEQDARIFHLGFSPNYRATGPNGSGNAHWGGVFVRNFADDGDCFDVRVQFDAYQTRCRDLFGECLGSIIGGDRDEQGEPGQIGGLARLPTTDHAPVFFLIEPQYGMWTDDLLACFDDDDRILRAIDPRYTPARLEWFPAQYYRDVTFKPSAVQGDAPTLRDAVVGGGWPTMDRLWGRYIFILLDRGVVRDAYREGVGLTNSALGWSADDPFYFTIADDPEDPDAAFFSVPAGETERIRSLVEQGFMVHAYSLDADEIEGARAAGAHLLTALELGDVGFEGAAVCNPVSSGPMCDARQFAGP